MVEKKQQKKKIKERKPATSQVEKKKTTKKSENGNKQEEKIAELEGQLHEQNDKYLRLQAEFDNFRKRTLKEKMEIMKSGGEGVLVNVLPVMDDFERALQLMNVDNDNTKAVKEGIELIYNRFKEFLKQNNVQEIDAMHQEFDTDVHEAITKIPSPSEELKGKVVDVVQKGYLLNEKVIRFAKVVVGE